MRMLLTATAALLTIASAHAEPLRLGVVEAMQQFDHTSTQPVVSVRLDEASSLAFGKFTQQHVGKTIDVMVDGEVRVTPRINEPIFGSQLQISGLESVEEATDLAVRLRAGDAQITVAPRD